MTFDAGFRNQIVTPPDRAAAADVRLLEVERNTLGTSEVNEAAPPAGGAAYRIFRATISLAAWIQAAAADFTSVTVNGVLDELGNDNIWAQVDMIIGEENGAIQSENFGMEFTFTESGMLLPAESGFRLTVIATVLGGGNGSDAQLAKYLAQATVLVQIETG